MAGKPDGIEQYIGVEPFVQVSHNLANPAHLDPCDDGRSHAVWIRKQHLQPEPHGWYLIFPDVGLAIELCHGACVSWDGRCARHCTTIASGVREKDALYGYFFGLNTRLSNARARLERFKHAVQKRHAWGTNYPPFKVDHEVLVRVVESGMERIKDDGVVVCVDEHHVGIAFYTGKNARQVIEYALTDADVVLAAEEYD